MPRFVLNNCIVHSYEASDGSAVDDTTIEDVPVHDITYGDIPAHDVTEENVSIHDIIEEDVPVHDVTENHCESVEDVTFDDVIFTNEDSQPAQVESSPARKRMRTGQAKTGHPKTTQQMMATALQELKTLKGVTLQAVQKYMQTQYGFDWRTKKHVIRRSLDAGLKSGLFIRKSGSGFSGRFKLGVDKARLAKEREQQKEKQRREREIKKYREQKLKEKEHSRKRIQRARDKAKRDAAETRRRVMEAREKVKQFAAQRRALEEEKWSKWRKQLTVMFK